MKGKDKKYIIIKGWQNFGSKKHGCAPLTERPGACDTPTQEVGRRTPPSEWRRPPDPSPSQGWWWSWTTWERSSTRGLPPGIETTVGHRPTRTSTTFTGGLVSFYCPVHFWCLCFEVGDHRTLPRALFSALAKTLAVSCGDLRITSWGTPSPPLGGIIHTLRLRAGSREGRGGLQAPTPYCARPGETQ